MRVKLTCLDCLVSAVFCYLIAILLLTWKEFTYASLSCPQPIHIWLLGNYFTFLMCRCMLVLLQGTYTMIHRRTLACVSVFSFLVLYPFLVVWTALGTLWFVQIATASLLECVRN
jgi:hypothetical protein